MKKNKGCCKEIQEQGNACTSSHALPGYQEEHEDLSLALPTVTSAMAGVRGSRDLSHNAPGRLKAVIIIVNLQGHGSFRCHVTSFKS